MNTPTRPHVPSSDVTADYWAATRECRLVIQRCDTCGATIHYPRAVCPNCLGEELSWLDASGRGTIYAAAVHHRPGDPSMADRVPYVVALVDLPEGVRIMTNVVGCDPQEARSGRAVRVTWEPLPDGRHLPLFELDE